MKKGLVHSVIAGSAALGIAWGVASAEPKEMPNDMTASPAFWRGFRPLVYAFGDGDPARAVSYLRAGTKILRSVDANLDRDEATKKFQEKAQDCMEEFDLRSFFKLLPERDGDYRYFAFAGKPAENAYRVWAAKGKDFEVNAKSARRGFGEASGMMRMRQLEKDDSGRYLVNWRQGAGFGDVAWLSIVAGLRDGVSLFDTPSQDAETPVILQAAEVFLKRTQPALGPEDRAVLATLWGSFPEGAKLLADVATGDDVIKGRDANTGITQVHWHSRFNLEKLKENYPHLTDYFKDLDKLAAIKLRLLDAAGHTLFDLKADTARMQSEIDAFVKGGRIVPSHQGTPLLDQTARFEKMRAHINLHFQVFRVHIYVDDMRVEFNFDEHATGAALSARIKQTPKIRVSGAAFGLFPTGMLDWFIPGDIEGLARKLMDVATKGNEGQGIAFDYRFERSPNGLATLDSSIGGEVLDSALIRFAMAIAAERVVPDEKQLDDIKRLGVAYRDAFDADVVRFGKHGKLPTYPAPTAEPAR
ncbi:MAG: hypothetical protein QM778_14770 [Myxococcales bacterium]